MPNLTARLFLASAVLLVVAACGNSDSNTSDAAPAIDAMVIPGLMDATPDPVTCTGADCTCPTGYACNYACPGGSCTITCETGSQCEVDCSGGGCTLACGDGASCNQTCTMTCTLACGAGSTCEQMCSVAHGGCECTDC